MKFNINQNVYVRLTPLGHKILREQHEQLCRDRPTYKRPYFEPNIDKDGYTRFQLHDLMHRPGSYIGLGCELPFDMDIKFNDLDLSADEPADASATSSNLGVVASNASAEAYYTK